MPWRLTRAQSTHWFDLDNFTPSSLIPSFRHRTDDAQADNRLFRSAFESAHIMNHPAAFSLLLVEYHIFHPIAK